MSQFEIDNVLNDFKNMINGWCETTSIQNKIPKNQMCKYAIQVFSSRISETQIRHYIDQQYKMASYVNSAKHKAKKSKIARIKSFGKKIGVNIVEVIEDTTKPLNEISSLLEKDGSK